MDFHARAALGLRETRQILVEAFKHPIRMAAVIFGIERFCPGLEMRDVLQFGCRRFIPVVISPFPDVDQVQSLRRDGVDDLAREVTLENAHLCKNPTLWEPL